MDAPPRKPIAVETKPPRLYASSSKSKDSAEISAPPPKAITAAINRCGTRAKYPAAAPRSRAEPATKPHNAAQNQTGKIERIKSRYAFQYSLIQNVPHAKKLRTLFSSGLIELLLCAISVSSVSLWLIPPSKVTTETQRTQRLHREIQTRTLLHSHHHLVAYDCPLKDELLGRVNRPHHSPLCLRSILRTRGLGWWKKPYSRGP